MNRVAAVNLCAGLALGLAMPAWGQILHDNGPLATLPVGQCLPPGSQASEVQPPNTNAGYNCDSELGYRVADDFTVIDAAGWSVGAVEVYAYERHSGLSSTFTGASLRIWSGRPGDAGSVVIFGDPVSNRLTSSVFTGIYRYYTGSCSTNRPVMANRLAVGAVLPPGVYWIEYSAAGTLELGPWAPVVTLVGQRGKPGANARHFIPDPGVWIDIVEGTPGTTPPLIPQDLPFRVLGWVVGPPCYANCDGSTTPPILNVADFICFQIRFAQGLTSANCDGSTQPPVLNVNDFVCYMNLYSHGCTAP